MAVEGELLRETGEDIKSTQTADYGAIRIQVIRACTIKSNARMNAYGHVYSNNPTLEDLARYYTINAAEITGNYKTDPVPESLEMMMSSVAYARVLPKGDPLNGTRFESDRPEQAVTLEALMDQEEERFWSLHETMLKMINKRYFS